MLPNLVFSHSLANNSATAKHKARQFETNYLPTTQFLPQVLERRVRKRLGEDVCRLFQCDDRKNLDGLVSHKLTEVVIFERDVLRPGSKFWSLRDLVAAPVVFPDLAEELRLEFRHRKEFFNFRYQVEKWQDIPHGH